MNDEIVKEFEHIDSSYLNTAYSGPIPGSASAAANEALVAEMNPAKAMQDRWLNLNETVRASFAKLLGCETHHISHNTSAAEIIGLVAAGFPFNEDDVVIGMEQDFPANVLPWKVNQNRFGFQFQQLPEETFFDTDFLLKTLPAKTRVVNLSHVKFDTGRRMDLLKIGKALKQRDIFFVVDSAQGFGGVSISREELKHIDVLACPSYKWLLGPYGHAFGYFSKHAFESIHPIHGQWYARANSNDPSQILSYKLETKLGAYCFDRGQALDLVHLSILNFSLEMLQKIGLQKIEKHNHLLTKQLTSEINTDLFEVVTPGSTEHTSEVLKSSIVSLRPQKRCKTDALAMVKQLAQNGVFVSCREGRIRASIHLFNDAEDIKNLQESLEKAAT